MNIKQKIINELQKKDFPNLKFLYSEEVLDIASEVLNDFLEQEKKDFETKLKTLGENISFDTFNEESELAYFWSLLNHLNNVDSSDEIRKIIEDFEVKLTDFWNEISYSKRNYEMLEILLQKGNLDLEQKKIIEDDVKGYKIRWINLDEEKQEELKKINLELSECSTKFSNNVLDSEKEFEYFLDTQEFLKEFSKSDLENARSLAQSKKKDWFGFDSSASSYISIMKYCSNSEIRKHFAESHSSFASSGKHDNRENVLKLIRLKDKKAKILWYKNYWELSLEFKMAKSPEEVIHLLTTLSNKAKNKALRELDEIKDFFKLESIDSWDMAYYSRILKEKKYKLDDKKLKEYFEFENTKKALFETVERLYNIKMKPCRYVALLHLYNSDIEVYEVYKWDKFISYFMWDYFAWKNKRSWAWADELRDRYKNKKSIVINSTNFVKSSSWKTLLTLWEVETLFHEFGHGIHSMLSKSKYSDLSGFWVEWDFVELPSQILEKWSSDTITINDVASHFETWEKLPTDMLESLEKLKYFGTWNFVLWQNTYAICDMMFHSGEDFKDIADLDKKFLDKVNSLSIFQKWDNYKMYCSFGHIFAWWYSAGYYSYIWADIIVDEIWKTFKDNWVYDETTAKKFEETILWAWSIKKASEMFYDFMGREVELDAFLSEKGLV
jgi:Zn-dependent oligopeptidase